MTILPKVTPVNAPDIEQWIISIGDICSCLCTIYHNGLAKVMLVDNVKVKEELRGNGYGTILMEFMVDFAKDAEVDCIELCVNKDNLPAKHLYEKIGMRNSGKFQFRLILRSFV